MYLESTYIEKDFGFYFVTINSIFKDVCHPVLPEAYTYVVGLHNVSLLIGLCVKREDLIDEHS